MRDVASALLFLLVTVASGCGGPCGTDAAGLDVIPGGFEQLAEASLNESYAIAMVEAEGPPGLQGLAAHGRVLAADTYSLNTVAYEVGPYKAGSRSGTEGFSIQVRDGPPYGVPYFWGVFGKDASGSEVSVHARRFWSGVLANASDVDDAVSRFEHSVRDDDGLVIHQFAVDWDLDVQRLYDDLKGTGSVDLEERRDADLESINGVSSDDVETVAFVAGPWVLRVEVDTREVVDARTGEGVGYAMNVVDMVFVEDGSAGPRGMSREEAAQALEARAARLGLPVPDLDADEVSAFGWCS